MTTDVFKRAMRASLDESTHFFGHLEIDMFDCVLLKGQGRVPYDPTNPEHQQQRPNVAIELALHCEAKDGRVFSVKRSMLAEDRRQPDWVKITLPSLQRLKVASISDVHRRWAHVEIVKAGTYVDKEGQVKDRTAMRVLALFDTEEAMVQARDRFYERSSNGTASSSSNGSTPVPTGSPARRNVPEPLKPDEEQPAAPPTPAAQSGNPEAKRIALSMLPVLLKAAEQQGGDVRANLAAIIGGIPQFAEAGLTISSPEIDAMLIPF